MSALSKQIFDEFGDDFDQCYSSDDNCNTSNNCNTEKKNLNSEKQLEKDLLSQLQTLTTTLVNFPIVHLTNNDFLAGTYRIRESGTYILDEDIEFNPTGTVGQPPGVGWFAAIGVETDNVIIDLAGHEIKESTQFLNAHIANVFSQIELDNSPFAGNANGVGFAVAGSTYPGETKYVSAHNVCIKNGSLAQSGHWGIHGNNNSGIFLQNLRIYDWEVAGITLNGLTNSYFSDLDISGNQHLIPVRSLPLNIALIQGGLASFGTTGPIGEQAVIINNNLTTYLQNNPQIYTPLAFPDGSVYGILIAGGSPFSEPFPLTPVDCANAIADTNGTRGVNILFKNINMHDITASPTETIALGSNNGGFLSLLPLGVFGMIRWNDMFDSAGNFNPNSLAIANAFVALQNLNSNPNLASQFPSNLGTILNSIVSNDSTAFFNNAIPIFGRNFMSSVLTGVFGFRVDCSLSNVIFTNCNTSSCINIADPSITLSEIPGASHYGNLIVSDNSGVDCWGYECSSANDVIIEGCSANNIRSENGDAFGFDMISSDTNFLLQNCEVNGVYGLAEDPASEAYGYRFKDNKNISEQKCPFTKKVGFCPVNKKKKTKYLNLIQDCTATNIISQRVSFGFSNESASQTTIKCSKSNNIIAKSSLNLQSTTNPKTAYGFSSDSGVQNIFQDCTAIGVSILGEDEFKAPSASKAVAFALISTDSSAVIKNCKSEFGKTGAGVYAGIFIDTNVVGEKISNFENCGIIKNSVYGQIHDILEY